MLSFKEFADKKGVAEGLNEMDKTQTPPGRDGDYDWTKKQIHLGPESTMKAKDVAKHALKILDKTMKKSHKKDVKEELTVDEQFDLIEELVMSIAEEHNLDPELVWEKFEELDDNELLEAAVDSKGHKSSTGGLTQKGRDYYNRKTGGNLKAPVTTPPSKLDPDSKAAKRRKSFCARMGGMKKRLTSAKTANDPDSRINKALRKWNC